MRFDSIAMYFAGEPLVQTRRGHGRNNGRHGNDCRQDSQRANDYHDGPHPLCTQEAMLHSPPERIATGSRFRIAAGRTKENSCCKNQQLVEPTGIHFRWAEQLFAALAGKQPEIR